MPREVVSGPGNEDSLPRAVLEESSPLSLPACALPVWAAPSEGANCEHGVTRPWIRGLSGGLGLTVVV